MINISIYVEMNLPWNQCLASCRKCFDYCIAQKILSGLVEFLKPNLSQETCKNNNRYEITKCRVCRMSNMQYLGILLFTKIARYRISNMALINGMNALR